MRALDGKQLPNIGDVFVFPLHGKLFSFCWVVRAMKPEYRYSSKLKKWMTVPDMVIACATWVGRGDPSEDDIAARAVLMLGKGRSKTPCLRNECFGPPRAFRKIATVKRPGIGAATVHNYSGFKGLQSDARRQWLLDHDRRKLLAQERIEAEKAAADEAASDADDKAIEVAVKKRKRATRATIARVELLPDWPGEKRHRESLEKRLKELVTRLRTAKSLDDKRAAIAIVVRGINTWNDRTSAIETGEREALATAIDDIGHAFGVRGHDLAGDERDW